MAEVVALVATCGELLGKTVSVIERITAALDRKKNGAKHLREIRTRVTITKQILESIVKDNKQHHTRAVLSAIQLLERKAVDLQKAAKELKQIVEAGKVKSFLDEFIRGDSRIEKFDKLQNELSMAQTTLITALVASNNRESAYSHIDVSVVEQVDKCFSNFPEVNSEASYPKRILQLIEVRGKPLAPDGKVCSVRTEDLEMLMQNLPWSEGKTVRIMSENKLKEFGLVTADVGKRDEDRPHVDTVIARNNEVAGNGYMIVGTVDYDTSMQMMTVRAGLSELKGNEQFAIDSVTKLVPGLGDLSPGLESHQRRAGGSQSHQARKANRGVPGSGEGPSRAR